MSLSILRKPLNVILVSFFISACSYELALLTGHDSACIQVDSIWFSV